MSAQALGALRDSVSLLLLQFGEPSTGDQERRQPQAHCQTKNHHNLLFFSLELESARMFARLSDSVPRMHERLVGSFLALLGDADLLACSGDARVLASPEEARTATTADAVVVCRAIVVDALGVGTAAGAEDGALARGLLLDYGLRGFGAAFEERHV